jgi:hypothetical protein
MENGSMINRSIWLGLTAAGFALGLGLLTGASAAPGPVSKASAGTDLIQSVDYKGNHRHRHYDRDGEYVRAPFTSVDTGEATHVEAPFTTVHTDRYGTYVRAPFVNLWIPR